MSLGILAHQIPVIGFHLHCVDRRHRQESGTIPEAGLLTGRILPDPVALLLVKVRLTGPSAQKSFTFQNGNMNVQPNAEEMRTWMIR